MHKKLYVYLSLILTVLLVFTACASNKKEEFSFTTAEQVTTETDSRETDTSTQQTETEPETKSGYSVSSSNDYVTGVGMAVLEAGGNAMDAAIAMGYALSVVEPFTNGLGGSGGMVVYDSNTGKSVFYDYRACSGASYGSDEVAIPGFVAGMEQAYEDYATMPMESLIEPAVYYAENGFTVNDIFASQISAFSYYTTKCDEYKKDDGQLLRSGDVMHQPALAATLRAIQAGGSEVFYKGQIAEDIAAVSSLSAEDLSKYQAYRRDALSGQYMGYTVYTANAPLSGLMLLQMLMLSEKGEMVDKHEDFDTYLKQLSLITSLSENSRYVNIGDPEFTGLDCSTFLTDTYLETEIQEVKNAGQDSERIETTSFSVVDSTGLAVSATNTLSDIFGSGIFTDGFWLNNSNSNFSKSGVNVFEPYKRSRTFTAPTIIVGENGYMMAIGTPGGNKIPGLLFFVITDILRYNTEPQEAVSKLRFLYSNGDLFIEHDRAGNTAISELGSVNSAVYIQTGIPWGSVSLAGYSDDLGAFGAFDARRGATYVGIFNR